MKYQFTVKKTECKNWDNYQENQMEHLKKCVEVISEDIYQISLLATK